jgi:hypothetical protein
MSMDLIHGILPILQCSPVWVQYREVKRGITFEVDTKENQTSEEAPIGLPHMLMKGVRR